MYERSLVKVTVDPCLTLRAFILRAYSRKYYAAVEIHPKFLINKDSLYIQHVRSFHCLYLFSLAPAVQALDRALHRINHYTV